MPSVRRLTAILAADVAGYSRLMGADEEGTHERLKAHFGQLVDPKIKQHRGRIVKTTGDGSRKSAVLHLYDAAPAVTAASRRTSRPDRRPPRPSPADIGRGRGPHELAAALGLGDGEYDLRSAASRQTGSCAIRGHRAPCS
jgi:class 3 adenylate cyclase